MILDKFECIYDIPTVNAYIQVIDILKTYGHTIYHLTNEGSYDRYPGLVNDEDGDVCGTSSTPNDTGKYFGKSKTFITYDQFLLRLHPEEGDWRDKLSEQFNEKLKQIQ